MQWGIRQGFDLLISESAGLCNRCSPHIKGVLAVCVIDHLGGVHTPRKIGPMLKNADLVVLTKGDIVSQAEREVFTFRVRQANATLASACQWVDRAGLPSCCRPFLKQHLPLSH